MRTCETCGRDRHTNDEMEVMVKEIEAIADRCYAGLRQPDIVKGVNRNIAKRLAVGSAIDAVMAGLLVWWVWGDPVLAGAAAAVGYAAMMLGVIKASRAWRVR